MRVENDMIQLDSVSVKEEGNAFGVRLHVVGEHCALSASVG